MANEFWLQTDLELRFARGGPAPLRFAVQSPACRIAICGPSASGKSTFLKILAGIERRASGVLSLGGETWVDTGAGIFRPASERRVGWVPQNALLFPHLNVEKNLLFAPAARNQDWHAIASALRIEHLLERLPRNLSGGESQRVALGRALLSSPRLLVLDEPFSALNDSLRTEIIAFLAKYCAIHGIPMVLATHRPSEAAALCEETIDWGETHRQSTAGTTEKPAYAL